MKGYIEVAIPVKPYIRAYIIKELGQEKIKLTRRSTSAIVHKLYDLLNHKQNHKKSEAPCNYGAKINIFLSIDTFNRRGGYLNHSNVRAFNRFVEKLVKNRMYQLMDDFIEVLPSIEAHLPELRKRLGTDVEDWSDDNIRKDYYRYRLNKDNAAKNNGIKKRANIFTTFGLIVPSEKADGVAF